MADVDDGAAGRPVGVRAAGPGADQQPGDGLDRPLGRREPYPLGRRRGDVLESLEGEGEVRPPLVPGHGVDLVEDHGPDAGEQLPRALRRYQ